MSQPSGAASNGSSNGFDNSSHHHKKDSRKASGHRHTLSLQKTELTINVYDLLPPSKISSLLWTVGAAFLHSGVVIGNREYAYGGHNRPNLTGVYWTKPRSEPPGGTFKCSIYHGFTIMSQSDIDSIIAEAAEEFEGTGYNLLSRNCNHFTNYLCEKLTGKPAPGWLNRAANIGVALPCIVPADWVSPPDHETADGELMAEENSDDESTESSRMLRAQQERRSYDEQQYHDQGGAAGRRTSPKEQMRIDRRNEADATKMGKAVRDTSGRRVPLAERAPVPDQENRR